MLQRTAEDEDASPDLDKPLNEKRLRQVVRFSVLPYVRELLTMQFGQADDVSVAANRRHTSRVHRRQDRCLNQRMVLMPIPDLDDIVCYEIGSDDAAPWEGTRSSLQGDLPALEDYARRGLIQPGNQRGYRHDRRASRVGLVVLPTGRRLIIRSKISGLTILEWLAYLGEFRPLQHWLPEKGIAAKDTEQDDWHRCIARLFLFAMEDVTRWHLRKDYAAIEIDEPQIRGRIIATKLAQRMTASAARSAGEAKPNVRRAIQHDSRQSTRSCTGVVGRRQDRRSTTNGPFARAVVADPSRYRRSRSQR